MNNHDLHHHELQQYRVSVGHARLEVQGATPADALAAARRQLGADFPRMWHTIYNMDESLFRIEPK